MGANVGTCAVVAGFVATESSAVAFELHPENADRIHENAALNDLDHVTVERRALSATNGTADLHVYSEEAGGGQHSFVEESDDTIIFIVDCRPASSVVANGTSSPNVLKIDVEEAEFDVLDGMVKTLAAIDCRVVFVEVHHEYVVSNDEVVEHLDAASFETAAIDGRGDDRATVTAGDAGVASGGSRERAGTSPGWPGGIHGAPSRTFLRRA